jgi:hypothetical protein
VLEREQKPVQGSAFQAAPEGAEHDGRRILRAGCRPPLSREGESEGEGDRGPLSLSASPPRFAAFLSSSSRDGSFASCMRVLLVDALLSALLTFSPALTMPPRCHLMAHTWHLLSLSLALSLSLSLSRALSLSPPCSLPRRLSRLAQLRTKWRCRSCASLPPNITAQEGTQR